VTNVEKLKTHDFKSSGVYLLCRVSGRLNVVKDLKRSSEKLTFNWFRRSAPAHLSHSPGINSPAVSCTPYFSSEFCILPSTTDRTMKWGKARSRKLESCVENLLANEPVS
jgi:hypothetical protein